MTKQHEKAQKAQDNRSAPASTASASATAAPVDKVAQATEQGRATRAAEISVAGNRKGNAEPKEAKKPAFEVDTALRSELLALSDTELLERAKERMRAVDASNTTVFKATGKTQDGVNGQDVSRSNIRSAVLDFVRERGGKAPANVIVAYMLLGSGKVYRGGFNFGYLSTKAGEGGTRGMVSRGLLSIVPGTAPAPKSADATA